MQYALIYIVDQSITGEFALGGRKLSGVREFFWQGRIQ